MIKRKFIATALLLCSLSAGLQAQEKPVLTLTDIWASPKFMARGVRGVNPMKDGKTYSSLVFDAKAGASILVRYSFETGKPIDTLIKSEWLLLADQPKPLQIDQYSFNEDETQVLLATNSEPMYRRSSRENNFTFSLQNHVLKSVSEAGRQALATFSPDGKKIAWMRDNNLYWKDLSSSNEVAITQDGKVNEIINGHCDWVYEEEFEFTQAFVWSPDGKYIAFLRFDERQVPAYTMPVYSGLYPKNETFKYPKAGEPNAKVTAHLYDLETGKTRQIELGAYEYLPRIGWTKSAETFWVQRTNRHQNVLDVVLVDCKSLNTRTLLRDSSSTYVEVTNDLTFLDDKQNFIWTSEKSGYRHLYLGSIQNGKLTQITKGNWEVSDYYGIDKQQYLYFLAANPTPMERQLFRIKINGKGLERLTQEKGYHTVSFSSDFSFFIDNHSSAGQPPKVTMRNLKGEVVRNIQDNQKLRELVNSYSFSPVEFFSFKTAENVDLNGFMIKPANFQPSKKYPVLMFVYGGPGAQTVYDRWGSSDYLWHQYLASKGYIVVSVDNRGTGARGEAFKKCTYLQLGKYETLDQMETARYLKGLSFVDGDRIGIYGWSYGGYMSTNCITKGADLFKAAVAVAPVINWRYYDSIYTERYMKTPQENEKGYDENSPLNDVDKLKGKFLLIHGTADDNVHFQNSMMMVKKMVDMNKQFDFMAYPDKNHGIYGGKTRLQLFTKITDFLLENL